MNRSGPALTPQQIQQLHQLKLHQQQQLLQEHTQKHQQQQQQLQQQQLKLRTQPLGLSQLANIQAQREALDARQKISQRKSLLMDDDEFFYPRPSEPSPPSRPALLKRNIMSSNMTQQHSVLSSPYSTPVKINPQMMGQRIQVQNSYVTHSPQQVLSSPQGVYTSPHGLLRRMDNVSYTNQSPSHSSNW